MTPGLESTRRRVTAGGGGSEAADLSAIRRSADAIDQLAARAARGLPPGGDPALVLLGALAADVDSPSARPPAGRAGRPRHRPAVPNGLVAWPRAAVAGAVLAGLAGTTSLICASMLDRLRCAPRGRGQPAAGRWAPRPARGRRGR